VEQFNHVESMQAASRDLISLARKQGADVGSIHNSGTFTHDARTIWFWRRNGVLHYSLQGRIDILPQEYQPSSTAFRGMWDEAGSVENMERAVELLVAWLLERKEIDNLPRRSVTRSGI
jgi:hypothetical protein